MGIRRTEASFVSNGRGALFRRAWLPEEPERLLVVIHGFAEHSGRYDRFGAWFAERGSAVHSYDQQGHGRSYGYRNYVSRFDDFLDDLERFLELARGEHPEIPLTLVGHSMGGLIAAAYARERKPAMLALVTSGAALSLGPSLSRTKIALSRVLRRVAPRLALDPGLPPEGLSRDPEVVRRYIEDDLIEPKMTTALAVEMIDAVARTASGGAEIEVPMLLLHGREDQLCDPSGSADFFHSLLGDIATRSALRVYPTLRHEIFNEPEQEEVFADLLDWVRSRERDDLPALAKGEAVPA